MPGPAGPRLAALIRIRTQADLSPARLAAGNLLAAAGPVVGIGSPVHTLDELPGAWREASAAARAALARPRLGPVAEWSGIGPYRLLAALPDSGPGHPVDLPYARCWNPRTPNSPVPPKCSWTARARRAAPRAR